MSDSVANSENVVDGEGERPEEKAEAGNSLALELSPREIVEELDRYVIGQEKAKRAVAVALRNRYRRELMSEDLRDEVVPKNILMVGPTGVGKTEIARRLARLARAPFMKVEATKYTEVGYVGRDVESMIRELTEIAVRMVDAEYAALVVDKAAASAIERLIDMLTNRSEATVPSSNPFQALLGGMVPAVQSDATAEPLDQEELAHELRRREREEIRNGLLSGAFDERTVELEVEEGGSQEIQVVSNLGIEEMGVNFQDLFGSILPKRKKTRRVSVADARKILTTEEAHKLIDPDEVKREAIRRVEQRGIVFLDELDKIACKEKGNGPDVSREGVQRDILPIVEGSTVSTKFGPVRTDHILFIAAGAFHISKPSDLIPELQGRFPIRVTLDSLGEKEFRRILSEPENALTKQYVALLATEGLEVEFTEDGIDELAKIATEVNLQMENIGARRLHTVMERVLEPISFDAPELTEKHIVIDRDYVQKQLKDIVENRDLSRHIL